MSSMWPRPPGIAELREENTRLREALAPFANRAAERAAGGPYRPITDAQWARALEAYTALRGELDQRARMRIAEGTRRRGGTDER
jgi:hypothetical protein